MGMSADDVLRGRLPETVPSDAPQPKKPDTPAAPAGEPKLYAGKYKTVEELERAYTSELPELNRKFNEADEARRRLEALAMSGGYPAPQGPTGEPSAMVPGPAYVPPAYDETQGAEFISRAEAARIAEDRANARIQAWQADQQRAQQLSSVQQYWREEFYRRNPDLKDDLVVVQGVTGEVLQRYAHLQPQVFQSYLPTILDEVATKTRERIAGYKAAGKAEAERAAQAANAGQVPGSGSPVSPPSTPQAPSMDDLRAEAINDSYSRYQRTKQPLGR